MNHYTSIELSFSYNYIVLQDKHPWSDIDHSLDRTNMKMVLVVQSSISCCMSRIGDSMESFNKPWDMYGQC